MIDKNYNIPLVYQKMIGNCEIRQARLVRNLETKQGRIRAEHEFWNEK